MGEGETTGFTPRAAFAPVAGSPDDDYHHENIARAIFNAVRSKGAEAITRREFEAALEINGILLDDRRMRETMERLACCADLEPIPFERFVGLLDPANATLVHRALRGDLVVPDFADFRNKLANIFEFCRDYRHGEVASYIPQLARVDPEHYALAVCTVDGQRFAFGDSDESYCVQSTCKPINYAAALDLLGVDAVHSHVGREPSGRSFNELTLNARGLPHNPMINAGAIMCASLIKPGAPLADRFDYVMNVWRSLAGGKRAGFDNSVFLSEKATADRNFALAYFMRENGAFPPDTRLHETLDFYFQCCSITVTAEQMAMVAATFANGGVSPLSDKRVFQSETTKNCLSLMYSCGMYDFSGEYAFTVGLPAKSGVSGSLFIVVPGVCGISLWSPRLDKLGNSVRGVEFSKRLVQTFAFHTYSGMVTDARLVDPRKSETERFVDNAVRLCSAAARGDVNELRRLVARGVDLGQSDYDGRTALHLAASESQTAAARYLLEHGAAPNPVDRWGRTPRDDARAAGCDDVLVMLAPHAPAEEEGPPAAGPVGAPPAPVHS